MIVLYGLLLHLLVMQLERFSLLLHAISAHDLPTQGCKMSEGLDAGSRSAFSLAEKRIARRCRQAALALASVFLPMHPKRERGQGKPGQLNKA